MEISLDNTEDDGSFPIKLSLNKKNADVCTFCDRKQVINDAQMPSNHQRGFISKGNRSGIGLGGRG